MVSQALRPLVLEALSRALEPVVLLLLKCGITWKDFSDLSKEKYVKVATEAFGIRGRPTNISRVAILSGIGRREVTKLRRAPKEQRIKQGFLSKPAQVLHAWYHDAQFLDSSGKPKDLEPEGADDSFAELVRRYAPDMPPVAMMKELRAAGALGDAEGNRVRVLKRSYIPRELNENLIRLWGSVLQDVGTTFEHNIFRNDTDAPRFERRAISLRVDASALPEFRELLEREGQAFLERIDEWITAHEVAVNTEEQRRTIRLGVGLYHIQDQALPLIRKRNRAVARTRGDTMS